MTAKTVYISIGNSDDKLTQREWCDFVADVDGDLEYVLNPHGRVHGRWFSAPDVQWQNACWCVEFVESHGAAGQTVAEQVAIAKARLRKLADVYRQDSIKWDEVGSPEFIKPEAS